MSDSVCGCSVFFFAATSLAQDVPVHARSNSVSVATEAGSTVVLDVSERIDVTEDIATYAWTLVTRPALSVAEISGSDQLRASLVPDVPGHYQARLSVLDAGG
ncbi:hypothetical protein, partial [Halovulum sp. GXIMD14793]